MVQKYGETEPIGVTRTLFNEMMYRKSFHLLSVFLVVVVPSDVPVM